MHKLQTGSQIFNGNFAYLLSIMKGHLENYNVVNELTSPLGRPNYKFLMRFEAILRLNMPAAF